MEKLSVIIPVYNGERYLAEAAASVRAQNWPGGTELVIVDDGSGDGTLPLARTLGDIVLTQPRGGAAKARNAGLRASTGAWIMLLDADDALTERALEELYAPFSARPELMAVFGRAEDFFSPELTERQRTAMMIRKDSYGGVLPGCALLRREVFERVGLFDETLASGETVAWQLKLRQTGFPAVRLDCVTLRRRLHLTNTGRVDRTREMKNYADILRRKMKEK